MIATDVGSEEINPVPVLYFSATSMVKGITEDMPIREFVPYSRIIKSI